jgi:hypothetical protein
MRLGCGLITASVFVCLVTFCGTGQSAPVAAEPAAVVSIELDGDNTLDLVQLGQPVKWRVKLAATSAPAGGRRLDWSIEDWNGPIATGSEAKADGQTIPLGFTPTRLGWHRLTARLLSADDRELGRGQRDFAVDQPVRVGGKRPFHYGITAHLMRLDEAHLRTELDLIARLGLDMVRTDAVWTHLQPNEDTFSFDLLDRCINGLVSRGVSPQLMLGYTARWATTGDPDAADWHQWHNVAPRTDDYVRYAVATVERYRDRVHLWEIWNEPDIMFWLSSPKQYADLFNAAAAAIAKADPSARVLNGGFAMITMGVNKNFLDDALPHMDQRHWSILAYHDYHTFAEMLARRELVRHHYEQHKAQIPIWINEGGYMGLLAGGERGQALTLVKKLSVAPALGVGAYVWYDLRNDGTDPKEAEHHMGLTSFDYQPKPVFATYQALIRQLAGRPFVGRLTPSAGLDQTWALAYGPAQGAGGGAGDDGVMVLWREASDRTLPIWVGPPAGGTVDGVDDLMGNATPLQRLGGGAVITLRNEPLYIRYHGGTGLPRIATFLDLPQAIVVVPGQSGHFDAKISNPLAQEAAFTCAVSSALTGFTVTAPDAVVRVPPGRTQSVRVAFTPTPDATAAPTTTPARGQAGSLTLRLIPQDGGEPLEANIACEWVMVVPQLANAGKPAGALEIDLSNPAQLYNLFTATPRPEMRFTGPQDLSARATAAHDGKALHLQVTVEDDIHSQSHAGSELWEGDSLQIGILKDDAETPMLEMTIGQTDDGRTDSWVSSAPPGATIAMGVLDPEQVGHSVRRQGTQTTYSVRIPLSSLRPDDAPTRPFRLSFLVNDNDGRGRKQWIELSPGIGAEKNPAVFPRFTCR